MKEAVDRLLESFKPSHYQVFLHLNKEQMTFTGTAEITGQQLEESILIKLHAKGLRIDEASFSIGGGVHEFVNHKHGEHDVLYLTTPVKIQGEVIINLKFFGEITEPMVGIYPCKFEHEGTAKIILATQFESHHAREVFPCVDEPAAKARFDFTLKSPPGEVVLFNTPQIKQSKDSDGWLLTSFATTPVMSTYLIAFVNGELAVAEGKTQNGTLTRLWVTPDNLAHTAFALDLAIRSLEKLEAFFGLPFPLPKIDHVGLPDFAAGAMENWGLITYREAALIVDDKNSSIDDKQWTAAVIAHELAHQWFGNLVTMRWWTDLWLNEGFATWMEKYIPDKLFPDWRLWEQFVTSDYLIAQSLDSLEHSHPIEVPVDDPDDIRSIFDAISYDKGASVIRMLHNYLGEATFRSGLSVYLEKHQYANASTADLWAALEAVSGKPVKSFMNAWTTQTGFPLLSASVSNDEIVFNQQRYFTNPVARETGADAIWPLPITSTHTDASTTLSERTGTWQVKGAYAAKLNRSQVGFYLVKYDPEHMDRLVGQIRGNELEPLDRLGLLSDAWQLCKGGYAPTIEALKLLDAYDAEDDAGVWEVIAALVGSVRRVFGTDGLREAMQPFLIDLVKRQLARLGWEETAAESHFDKLLRPTILSLASLAYEPSVLAEAHKRYTRMNRPEDIHPDLRSVVFATVARDGGDAEFNKFLDLYQAAALPQVKLQLAGALCGFKKPELIVRSLDMIRSDSVRLQEVAYWVSNLMANRHSKDAAWAWLKDNWEWIVDKFGTDIMTFSYFPKFVGRSFATQAMQDDYTAFFNEAYTAGIDRPVAQGLESLQWQTDWNKRDAEAVNDFFSNWKPAPEPALDKANLKSKTQ